MKLKVLNWNVRRAKSDSKVWEIITQINPDILTLQEVVSIPYYIEKKYSFNIKKATTKSGNKQIFSTAVFAKRTISDLTLNSKYDWINSELEFFKGNLVSSTIEVKKNFRIKVISVYSPAWPVSPQRLKGIDISKIKLKENPQLWCTEILWAALKNIKTLKNDLWIVAGDFNSSITFDYLWKGGPSGNQEIVERLFKLGLVETLKFFKGELVPTYKNPKGGKVIHQIDHMYVTPTLLSRLVRSNIGNSYGIFEDLVSDHLPIISTFRLD